jgi:hypothetical protein
MATPEKNLAGGAMGLGESTGHECTPELVSFFMQCEETGEKWPV